MHRQPNFFPSYTSNTKNYMLKFLRISHDVGGPLPKLPAHRHPYLSHLPSFNPLARSSPQHDNGARGQSQPSMHLTERASERAREPLDNNKQEKRGIDNLISPLQKTVRIPGCDLQKMTERRIMIKERCGISASPVRSETDVSCTMWNRGR